MGLRVDRQPPGAEALSGEWEGCYSIHFGNDRYRLIWEFDEETQAIWVLAADRKQITRSMTVYDRPRPRWETDDD